MVTINTLDSTVQGFSLTPDDKIMDFEQKYGAHHYARLGLVVRKAKGCWLTSADGSKYLDCLAAYSAANPGHHHPRIVEALVKALKNGYASVISNVVYTDSMGEFLKKAATLLPQLGPRFGSNGNKGIKAQGAL